MISSRKKAIVFVFALLIVTGFIAVGCKQKPRKSSWVNTDSLPGHTFSSNKKKHNSNIVYLGSEGESSGANFGPKDVSFDFYALR